MPLEAAGVSSMAPLRAKARKWSRTALGRILRAVASSAIVGGKPYSLE